MQKLVFALVALLALQSASADWAIFANYGNDRFCSEIYSFIALEVDECMVIDDSYSRMWDGTTYSYYNSNECEEDATLDSEDVEDCFEYHPGRYAKFVIGDLATPVNALFPLAEALYTGSTCTVDELHGDVNVFPYEFVEEQFNNTQEIYIEEEDFDNFCANGNTFDLVYQDFDGENGFTGPWIEPSTTEWLIFKAYGTEEDCDTDGEDATISYFALEAGFCQNGRYTDGDTYDDWGGADCENVGSSDYYTDDNTDCFEYGFGIYAKRVANGMEYPVSATYYMTSLRYTDCADHNTLSIDVSIDLASDITDPAYNECYNIGSNSRFIWLHEDYEDYGLDGYEYNDLSGADSWVIFGNHDDDEECGEAAHTFIAMQHDVCYKDNLNNYYKTDGDAYGRFALLEDCEDDDLDTAATYEEDIENCFQPSIGGSGDYYTAVDKDRNYPINDDYPLAWASYDEEDCEGQDLSSNVITVVKADSINEIWAQSYSYIVSPQRVEKVVHSCETWGDGSYYYWGDEVLESMALDMTFDWTESEDSASMITSSLLMIIAAFAMIFA